MSEIDIEAVRKDLLWVANNFHWSAEHTRFSKKLTDNAIYCLDQLAKENERLTKERDEWKAAAVRSVNDTLRTKHAAMQEAIVEAVRRAEPVGGIDDIIEPLLPHFHMPEPVPVDPLVEVFRSLPLHGDAGCDKLTDAEWVMVAEAARNILEVRKIGEKADV